MISFDSLLRQGKLTMSCGTREWVGAKERGCPVGWPDHWRTRCRLSYQGRRMTVIYRQGVGLSDLPTRREVTEAVISDSLTLNTATNFEEWAQEMGMDTDSRIAESIYLAVKRQDASVRKLFGDEYDEWADAVAER